MRSQSLRVLSRVSSLSTPPQSSGSKSRRRIREVILTGCGMDGLSAIRQPIDLRSHDEVAFGQSINLVGPNRDFHSAPREINVGMMTLFLRQCADFVGKNQCFAEIFEGEYLLQVMFVDKFPAIPEFPLQVGQRLSLERRHAAFARDAISFGQFAHDAPNIRPNHPDFQPAVGDAWNQSRTIWSGSSF